MDTFNSTAIKYSTIIFLFTPSATAFNVVYKLITTFRIAALKGVKVKREMKYAAEG